MFAPVITELPVSSNGTYTLKFTVTSSKDSPYILLCESRRWLYEGFIKANKVKEHSFTVNVCDTHPFGGEYTKKDYLTAGVMGEVNYTCDVTPCKAPTVYIAGDSTVADQKADYPYIPSSTYCGWGQMFPLYLKEGIAVSNHAQSGLSTQDFKEANWLVVKERLKEKDYLIIEFGHNDQKQASLAASLGYTDNLIYFIKEARSLGATPILCSPINRIIFEKDGTLKNLLGEYKNAVKAVSKKMQVPFLDLWSRSTEYMEAAGEDDAWDYFWGDSKARDYTHTNDIGGKLIAKFVANEMIKSDIKFLSEYIKTEAIVISLPKPSGKKNQAKDINDYRTIGLVNLPELNMANLDKDITKL